jgi:alpha-amylase
VVRSRRDATGTSGAATIPAGPSPGGGSNRTWHRLGEAYYYGVFWGGMPDLNFGHPPVREEMKRLAGYWLARGVDGFRLDATRHLFANGPGEGQNDQPETHAFLRELASHVRASFPRALLVGENWTNSAAIARYYGSTAILPEGDELPLSFNFPLAAGLVQAARDGMAAPVLEVFAAMREHYPPGVMDAPFLTNHDMIRVATQLGGDRAALAQAAAMLLTLPGTPFLYYGEEIGMENGPGGDDRQKRTPMPWDASPGGGFTTAAEPWFPFAPGQSSANVASERTRADSLLATYRGLVALRGREDVLRRGELAPLDQLAARHAELLGWELRRGVDRRVVLHNLGTRAVAVDWPASMRVAWSLGEVELVAGQVHLPARASVVLAPAAPDAGGNEG